MEKLRIYYRILDFQINMKPEDYINNGGNIYWDIKKYFDSYYEGHPVDCNFTLGELSTDTDFFEFQNLNNPPVCKHFEALMTKAINGFRFDFNQYIKHGQMYSGSSHAMFLETPLFHIPMEIAKKLSLNQYSNFFSTVSQLREIATQSFPHHWSTTTCFVKKEKHGNLNGIILDGPLKAGVVHFQTGDVMSGMFPVLIRKTSLAKNSQCEQLLYMRNQIVCKLQAA